MGNTSFSEEVRAVIALHLLPDLSARRFHSLLLRFGSACEILRLSEAELLCVEEISHKLAHAIAAAGKSDEVDREIERAAKAGVTIITLLDPFYPENLKNISDHPPVLYVRGTLLPEDAVSVAVVGSRRPTPYGRSAAGRFARDLARTGVTVVSGLARGIDTEAHEGALSSGGRTIAVLGSGLSWHYPPENRKLEDRVAAAGCLLSEFPMAHEPDRTTFPQRNRIISGLSLGTLVVEADEKSGALITARCAAEQGKDVFAVPGPIFSNYSRGPHRLLKEGAHLAETAEDILTEIGALATWVRQRQKASPAPDPEPAMNDLERGILAQLDAQLDGLSIDRIVDIMRLSSAEIAGALLDMELKGLVRTLPGKTYVKIR